MVNLPVVVIWASSIASIYLGAGVIAEKARDLFEREREPRPRSREP